MTSQYAIVASDFVRTGGMDWANYSLASYLARSGRAVHLITYRVEGDLGSHPNVVVHRVPKPANAYALGGPLLGAVGLAHAAQLVSRGGAVLSNGGNCPFPGANWVHYVHAGHWPLMALGGWRRAKAHSQHCLNTVSERIALRMARVVIANSEMTRRQIIERVGVTADRVRTVYYGTDPARFHPFSAGARAKACDSLGWIADRPRVAFVGGLGDRRKGFDVLYEAWRLLCRSESWDADLVVVGQGAELPLWRAAAARDGLMSRIAFMGLRNDVPRILAACDALVAPARYEAYGLGVHEALCCGIPAMVSAAAGVAERYPSSLRDLLVEDSESPDALASCLMRWRERTSDVPALMMSFSEQLRARTWDDMAREITSLCDA